MTSLEKIKQLKDLLHEMCEYGDGCEDCRFFNPEDDTDGEVFCALRDDAGRTPYDEFWHMGGAFISH